MKVPQREIIACPFHSERKQKSEEMGPLETWGAEACRAQAPVGTRSEEVDNLLQREKSGPSLGRLCSNRSGFRVGGRGALPSAKLTGRPLWCPVTQQPTTKTPLQGILGERQRTRRKWGMGTELSESRVWPRPYFPATKAPSIPTASVRALDTKGP